MVKRILKAQKLPNFSKNGVPLNVTPTPTNKTAVAGKDSVQPEFGKKT